MEFIRRQVNILSLNWWEKRRKKCLWEKNDGETTASEPETAAGVLGQKWTRSQDLWIQKGGEAGGYGIHTDPALLGAPMVMWAPIL